MKGEVIKFCSRKRQGRDFLKLSQLKKISKQQGWTMFIPEEIGYIMPSRTWWFWNSHEGVENLGRTPKKIHQLKLHVTYLNSKLKNHTCISLSFSNPSLMLSIIFPKNPRGFRCLSVEKCLVLSWVKIEPIIHRPS